MQDFNHFQNRDYTVINIEEFWTNNFAIFKRTLIQISQKRVGYSTEDITSFKEYLNDLRDERSYQYKLRKVINKSLKEFYQISSYNSKFDEWADYFKNQTDQEITLERAYLIRKAILLIHREKKKTQLEFNFPLPKEQLLNMKKNELISVGKLFLNKYDNIPYYYGFSNLLKIASNNIEQFLSFASEMFETILSKSIASNSPFLSAYDQEIIIKRVVNQKWEELDILLLDSIEIKRFLNNVGNFLQSKTFSDTASYAPGLTGFAIHQKPNPQNVIETEWEESKCFSPLRKVLKTCLAFNLFVIHKVTQGTKERKWNVYYMNRWLCVKFNLPLQLGSWNKIDPYDLLKWTKKQAVY